MIKWIVIGLLVAGTFGVIWSAPWKDDVARLTDDVQQRLGVLDEATGGDCSKVGRAVPGDVRAAGETIAAEARRNPDATVPGLSGQSPSTVGQVARRQASQIGECIKRLPRSGAGWADLQKRLEVAAQSG